MTIFNWVHRKFHHKDGFVQYVNKAAELVTNIEMETQVLPEHVTIDSILTIGTFGFCPLAQLNKQNECLEFQKEETHEKKEHEGEKEIENEFDEEEVNPLLSNSFRSGFDENDVEIYELGLDSTDSEDKKGKGKEKKERITLADLLVADDSDDHVKHMKGDGRVVEKDSNYKKKTDVVGVKRKGLSFAKKLIPGVGEDSRPIKKLHQLMRRMTKRKIHPDMEEEFQKAGDDAPIKPGPIADKYGANESVSLLPIADSIVRQYV
ncbi:protein TILLER ANGLE CONTROL 1 [Rhododendron vialii]|uniref:protein TILLER ANGLE CONTROL 1 n=1 Tax=Rhododendron vialii TaxID=182163 RepID=UPI00265F587A|nr:protein TILLER ANGLE CONTROL 1 [Rhododendron vialii]